MKVIKRMERRQEGKRKEEGKRRKKGEKRGGRRGRIEEGGGEGRS